MKSASVGEMESNDPPGQPMGIGSATTGRVTAPPPEADFTTFFYKNYANLVRTLYFAGAVDAKEDIAQEAFAVVLTHWRAAMQNSNPVGYLYRCAFRILSKQFKKDRHRYNDRLLDDEYTPSSDANFEEVFCTTDQLELLVTKLPPRARACVVAYFNVGMTTEEIASSLKIAPGTVRKHLSDAKRTLRELLKTQEGSEDRP